MIKDVMCDFGPSHGFCNRQIISLFCLLSICKNETVATACIAGDETDLGRESRILEGMARRGMQMKDVESHPICQLGFTTRRMSISSAP